MRRTQLGHRLPLLFILAAALGGGAAACGDDGGGGGTPDPTTCRSTPDEDLFPDVAVNRQLTLEGLECPVDVIVDSRGIPHIYASSLEDAVFAQGYLMAEDRFAQMEFLRRSVLGTLAEVLGTVPGFGDALVAIDAEQRFLGFRRQGRALYESLPEDAPTRRVADAFVGGVNVYVAELQAGLHPEASLSQLTLVILFGSPNFGPWEPADVLALARFQSWGLSYDAGSDITNGRALAGALEAFPADATEPAIAARKGVFADLWSQVQARRVYTLDGFPNVGTDTGTRALDPALPEPAPRALGAPTPLPSMATLDRARPFAERIERIRRPWFGDEFRGSNNWIVSGEHTATGLPLLANDPHLQLISPSVWWYTHLNTAARGGEIDVMGVAFAGIPGVVIGWNRSLAWGVTTTGYDVTDVYAETIDRGAGLGTVTFRGAEVPIETIEETILVDGSDPVVIQVQNVPHHGPLLAAPPPQGGWEDTEVVHPTEPGKQQALSIRYTGHEPTNELDAFIGLWSAESLEDATTALESFRVGAQNFVFGLADGTIAYSSQARIPQRTPASCSWSIDDDGAVSGISPLFPLPGQGDHEWTDDLSDRYIPHAVNPAAGFLATANQDNVGVTDDGNVCNGVDPDDPADDFYLGGYWAVGYRKGRIDERLAALVERGNVTAEDMRALQAETRSSLGETMRDPIVAALDRIAAARANPSGSDDEALKALLAETEEADLDAVADARDRLAAWTLETPHAWRSEDAQEIADSIATTLFVVPMTRLAPRAFGDETGRIGERPSSSQVVRTLERMIVEPERLFTYDAALGDSVLWDDLETPDVVETRDERILRAYLDALAWLEARLGSSDPTDWRWWRLHGVRFEILFPILGGADRLSIPPDGSDFAQVLAGFEGEEPVFVDAYPRAGDYGAPDVCNFSFWAPESFMCGSGPSVRLVAAMGEGSPSVIGAIPGGQSIYPDSPQKSDEAELWWQNLQPAYLFEDREAVGADAQRRDRIE